MANYGIISMSTFLHICLGAGLQGEGTSYSTIESVNTVITDLGRLLLLNILIFALLFAVKDKNYYVLKGNIFKECEKNQIWVMKNSTIFFHLPWGSLLITDNADILTSTTLNPASQQQLTTTNTMTTEDSDSTGLTLDTTSTLRTTLGITFRTTQHITTLMDTTLPLTSTPPVTTTTTTSTTTCRTFLPFAPLKSSAIKTESVRALLNSRYIWKKPYI